MKLYIKRDKSSENSMFIVFDELCKEKYLVTGSKDKLKLKNLKGETLLKIKRIPFPTLRTYSITAKSSNIKLVISSLKTAVNCYFYGIGWHIRGNIFIKSFDIIDADNSLVATHIRRFSPCGDGYELNVINEDRELFSIATALCVNLEAKVDTVQMQPI
ncbi:MAG: hypothetical protein ACI4HO_10640 [Ruminococcus sp.]